MEQTGRSAMDEQGRVFARHHTSWSPARRWPATGAALAVLALVSPVAAAPVTDPAALAGLPTTTLTFEDLALYEGVFLGGAGPQPYQDLGVLLDGVVDTHAA